MFNPNVTPYTPGNIDDTTRMLIGLKQKGQLQQYVQQHSQDPNLVALALYVNNLDNAARGAQAMQAQQQPQPTVLEEKMAQMAPQQLPEEVGIGALPVQGMDNFADGGIVGYAGGGDNFGPNPASGPAGRLAYDNEPVLKMAGGGIVAFADGGGTGGVLGDIPGMTQSDLYAKAKAKAEAGQPLSATEKALLFASAPFAAAADVAASPINFLRRMVRNPMDESPMPSYTPVSDARAQALGLGQLPAAQPASMDNVIPQGTSLGASPSNAEIEKSLGLGALAAAKGRGDQPPAPPQPRPAAAAAPAPTAPGSIANELKAFRESMGIKDEAFDREKELASRKEYLGDHPAKAQLERLSKLDQMAKAEREDAFNMSLLRAGLGMMASKSPFALVGIGEGATKGVESYEDALKSLKAAERDREKMRMDVETAAYGARAGDLKAVDDKFEKVMDRKERNADRLSSIYGTLRSAEMQVQGHKEAARISAGAMPPNLRAALLLGTGNTEQERLESGLAKLNTLTGEKPELAFAQLYAKHVAEAQKNMTEPLSPTEFAKLMRGAATAFRPQVVDTDNPSAKVYGR